MDSSQDRNSVRTEPLENHLLKEGVVAPRAQFIERRPMKYRLAWKYVDTEQVKRGRPLFASRHFASQVAVEMNAQWAGITHWAEEASEEDLRPPQEAAPGGLDNRQSTCSRPVPGS
jgi:hypothetical protein